MGSLFSKPKIPKPTPPEPTPAPITVNDDVISQETADRMRRRKGRASTLLAKGAQSPTLGVKSLTGV